MATAGLQLVAAQCGSEDDVAADRTDHALPCSVMATTRASTSSSGAPLISLSSPSGSALSSTTPESSKSTGSKGGGEIALVDPLLVMPVMILMAITILFLLGRILSGFKKHRRHHAALRNDDQCEHSRPSMLSAAINQHLMYAPIFSTRHSREFRPLRQLHMGTLPTRFEATFLVIYLILNVVFAVATTDWSQNMGDLGNRMGTLAVVNLIPLVLISGRNNPLISLLGVPFNTFNMFHRWLGRIIAAEAIFHVIAIVVTRAESSGLGSLSQQIKGNDFVTYGLVSIVAFVSITLQAASPVRHAFYEFFLHFHIALAILAFVTLWYHTNGRQHQKILIGPFIAWALERLFRLVIIFQRNLGAGRTTASIRLLPGNAALVDVTFARPGNFKPGQHIYLYIPSVGWWTSHPFSVAWVSAGESDLGKEISRDWSDPSRRTQPPTTKVSLIARGRDGFTKRIIEKAKKGPSAVVYLSALVEGPYGVAHSFNSYGTVVLIAGGIGITHQTLQVRELVAGFVNRTVAARRISLVWIVKRIDHLLWIQPWMLDILAMPSISDVLHIHIYITVDPASSEGSTVHCPWTRTSALSVLTTVGKPCIDEVLEKEMRTQIGAMVVSVCGPGHLGDDVRKAVRARQRIARIDLQEEAFSW